MKDKIKFRGIGRQLIEKLRANGYAFDSIKTVLDRKFKIAKMLNNDAVLATALSPELKEGIQLRLEFCVSSIKIYANDNDVIGDKVLLHIEDAYDRSINDLIFKIGKLYSEYFYSNKDLKKLIESFDLSTKRENKLKMLLGKLNKDLPLRYWYDVGNHIHFYFGSSVFTIHLSYEKKNSDLHSCVMLYKSSGRTYNYCGQYELNSVKNKYMIYLKDILSIKYLTTTTVGIYLTAFNAIKKLEKFN
ncbi:MAG: hypothetical protein RLZZ546_672 [Bacteroidota bacterium]|jgi:hypothetical protein